VFGVEKLPNWLKWIILLAGVAAIGAVAFWLDGFMARVEQLPPDGSIFGAAASQTAD
jgi:hypothetical protein